MSQRDSDHWSIGEILSIIQEEFPVVTISKIRFLESKGLVSPERTPSGYRRFYQEDLDRLEWILRQQRDHYLPLKVIRSRLESGDLDGENEIDTSPSLPFGGLDVEPQHPAPRTGRPNVKPDGSEQEDNRTGDGAGDPAAVESGEAEPVDVASNVIEPDIAVEEIAPVEAGGAEISAPESAAEPETGGRDEADPQPGQRSARSDVQSTEAVKITDRRGSPGIGSNAAMTKDELAEASGCSLETLNELERFGLLSGRMIGPTVLYDGEALSLAQLAAKFVEHGLEARHLRTLKISAEHEVSLLTQVVEPMMHRRDASAREQSLATLADLVETAAELRAILIRQMVRELLPSQRG